MNERASISAQGDAAEACRVSPAGKSAWPAWAIVLLLLGHCWATCVALPPQLLRHPTVVAWVDYAIHSHRAYVYRAALQESGKPWGCDPMLCGGIMMHPAVDLGSTPYELLAVLLPGVDTGRLVIAFALGGILILPFLLYWGGRLLRLDSEGIAWGLLAAMGLLWFVPTHRTLVDGGMIAFVLASYLCLPVLVLYDRFLRAASLGRYLGATAAGCLLFLVHPFGPLSILPGLVWLVLATPGTRWRWRAAAAASPLIIAAVNSFWLIPVLLSLHTPPPPWTPAMQFALPYFVWSSWRDILTWVGPGLIAVIVLALLAAAWALLEIARRQSAATAVALALTLLTSLSLLLFASFWSPLRILQPVRFGTVFFTLLVFLAASGGVALRSRLRIPGVVSAAAMAITAGVFTAAFCYAGPRLANSSNTAELVQFIRTRTQPQDRLLVEGMELTRFFSQALPQVVDREVVGSAYPDLCDPVQFLPQALFGKGSGELSLAEARQALHDFGINWAFVRSAAWREFFRKLSGSEGETAGDYQVFRVGQERSRFLVGSGNVVVGVNHIELSDVQAPDGYVVLRYRYHPGWVCEPPSSVERFPLSEDGAGLLLITHPQPHTQLYFDPLRALRQPWPAAKSDSGSRHSEFATSGTEAAANMTHSALRLPTSPKGHSDN